MKAIYSQKSFFLLLIPAAFILITGCAQSEAVDQCLTGHTYGFFGGKGVRRIQHTRVNFNSQRFDKAEIVE